MCLAIPGQIIEVVDEANRLARVDVAGVRRNVNIGLLDDGDGGVGPGDWVLIHVGFAISQGRRGGGARDARAARADGRRLRAGARGAEGERDRVSSRRRARIAARPLHHLRRRRRPDAVVGSTRAAAWPLCADDDGRAHRRSRSRWWRRSRRATRCWSTPASRSPARRGRPREVRRRVPRRRARPRAGRRDPRRRRARPPLQGDGGVRRPHPLDLQVRGRRPAAGQRRAGPRPGLPGLRDPDGPGGRRHRPRARAPA